MPVENRASFMALFFPFPDSWETKVIKTSAINGDGVNILTDCIRDHRKYLESNGILQEKRNNRLRQQVKDIIIDKLNSNFWTSEKEDFLNLRLENFKFGIDSPYKIAEDLNRPE